MLHLSKSVLMKRKTNLHIGWPEDEYILINLKKISWYNILLHTSIGFCSVHIKNRIYGTSFCRLSGLPWGKPSSCTLHTSPTLVLDSGKMVKSSSSSFSQFSFVHNQYSHAPFAKHSVLHLSNAGKSHTTAM